MVDIAYPDIPVSLSWACIVILDDVAVTRSIIGGVASFQTAYNVISIPPLYVEPGVYDTSFDEEDVAQPSKL